MKASKSSTPSAQQQSAAGSPARAGRARAATAKPEKEAAAKGQPQVRRAAKSAALEPTDAEIALEAYLIYEERQKAGQDGDHASDWEAARARLLERRGGPRSAPARQPGKAKAPAAKAAAKKPAGAAAVTKRPRKGPGK